MVPTARLELRRKTWESWTRWEISRAIISYKILIIMLVNMRSSGNKCLFIQDRNIWTTIITCTNTTKISPSANKNISPKRPNSTFSNWNKGSNSKHTEKLIINLFRSWIGILQMREQDSYQKFLSRIISSLNKRRKCNTSSNLVTSSRMTTPLLLTNQKFW